MGSCRMGLYTTNDVVTHGAIVCFGYSKQGMCDYLLECCEEIIKPRTTKRKWNNFIKKLEKSK